MQKQVSTQNREMIYLPKRKLNEIWVGKNSQNTQLLKKLTKVLHLILIP